jgi:hypothetical protein
MLYSFVLFIWTASGCGNTGGMYKCTYEWRESGTFYAIDAKDTPANAKLACEFAAQQLAIPADRFRCVRSR